MAANDYVNATQQIGSAITYAKRYAFVNKMGVIFEEEDDDVRSMVTPKAKVFEDAEVEKPEEKNERFSTADYYKLAMHEVGRLREIGSDGATVVAIGSLVNKNKGNPDKLKAFVDILQSDGNAVQLLKEIEKL